MKKLSLIITLILVLLLVSGCGNRNEGAETEKVLETIMPAAEGVILINGRVQAESDEKIFAEYNPEGQLVFPLDAAMFYYASNGGAGKQNIASYRYSVNVSEKTIESWQKGGAAYRCLEGAENRVFMYDVHSDEEGVWFTPKDCFQDVQMYEYTSYTVTRDSTLCEITLTAGQPMAYITVSCRKGNEELGSGILRPEEMEDYTEYPLPEGTDQVEITACDADNNVIEKKMLRISDSDYAVLYENGGQFLNAKTLHLKWTLNN